VALQSVIIALELAIILAVHAVLSWTRPAARDRNLVGQGFSDPNHPGTLRAFPSLKDEAQVQFSLVIPACSGDAQFLQGVVPNVLRMMQARFQSDRSFFTYEVILVVCQTSPASYDVAMRMVQAYGVDRVRALRVTRQLSSGRALREGALRSRGETVVLVDRAGLEIFPQVHCCVIFCGQHPQPLCTCAVSSCRHCSAFIMTYGRWRSGSF
jgi:hypothetical protein